MAVRPSPQTGQTLLEFALALPLLLLLLLGIVETGRLAGHLLILRHAGYNVVRQAAVGGSDEALTEQLVEALTPLVPTPGTYAATYLDDPETGEQIYQVRFSADGDDRWVDLVLRPAAGTRTEGELIQVILTLHFRPVLLGWILPAPLPFSVEAVGRTEVPPVE